MGLTSKFDTRLQDVLLQNKHLKAKVEQLQVNKTNEYREVNNDKKRKVIYKERRGLFKKTPLS